MNSNSIVRNLCFNYATPIGAYYRNFICYATGLAGKITNCYFNVKSASDGKIVQDYGVYVNSSNSGSIENCTLYFDTNTVTARCLYKAPLYKNCITNFKISKSNRY